MSVKPRCFIEQENVEFKDTGGVSQNNASLGFLPAFQDSSDNRVEVSRFKDGRLAPFHTLDGMPDEWVVRRDINGRVVEIRNTIISGFVRFGRFFSRQEAADFITSAEGC